MVTIASYSAFFYGRSNKNGHVCFEELGDLIETLVPAIFQSLKEYPIYNKDALFDNSWVPEEQLTAFAKISYDVDKDGAKLLKTLKEFGDSRDQIRHNLGVEIRECQNCSQQYRQRLNRLVERGDYESISDADRDLLGLGYKK